MKRYAAALLLLAATSAWAGFSIGLDVDYDLDAWAVTSDASDPALIRESNRNAYFGLRPYIGIRPGDVLEIQPIVAWGMMKDTYAVEDSGAPARERSTTQHSLSFGIGVGFHLIRGEVLGLSLGPEVTYGFAFRPKEERTGFGAPTDYDKYFNGRLTVGVPVSVDFHFTEHVAMRMSSNVIGFRYWTINTTEEGATESDEEYVIDFDILTDLFSPSLALFFTF
jgi:hypothetical protein